MQMERGNALSLSISIIRRPRRVNTSTVPSVAAATTTPTVAATGGAFCLAGYMSPLIYFFLFSVCLSLSKVRVSPIESTVSFSQLHSVGRRLHVRPGTSAAPKSNAHTDLAQSSFRDVSNFWWFQLLDGWPPLNRPAPRILHAITVRCYIGYFFSVSLSPSFFSMRLAMMCAHTEIFPLLLSQSLLYTSWKYSGRPLLSPRKMMTWRQKFFRATFFVSLQIQRPIG